MAGGLESDREGIKTESEVGGKCFEAGGRGHEPRKPEVSRGWKRQTDPPLELLEGMQTCQHLDFSQAKLISDF